MKVDDNPFPNDQNMVDAKLFKGKTKVLTSVDMSKLKGVVTNKRADMSREKHREMVR